MHRLRVVLICLLAVTAVFPSAAHASPLRGEAAVMGADRRVETPLGKSRAVGEAAARRRSPAPDTRVFSEFKPPRAPLSTHVPKGRVESATFPPGVRRLVSDYVTAKINRSQFTEGAAGILGYGSAVPARYRNDRLTEQQLAGLSSMLGGVARKLPERQSAALALRVRRATFRPAARRPLRTARRGGVSTAAASGPSLAQVTCGDLFVWRDIGYPCAVSSDVAIVHFTDIGDNAVDPAKAVNTLEAIGRAYPIFEANMGNRPYLTGKVDIVIGAPGVGSGVAVPATSVTPLNLIGLPRDYVDYYLPVHELFHHFQYPRLATLENSVDIWDPLLPVNLLDPTNPYWTIQRVDWWMEATAEWAADYAEQADPTVAATDAHRYDFMSHVGDYLSQPWRGVYDSDGPGGRYQYGAVSFASWLDHRYWGFVWYSWHYVIPAELYVDGNTFIKETLDAYRAGDPGVPSLESTVDSFWSDSYTMCLYDYYWQGDSRKTYYRDWCGRLSNDARLLPDPLDPAHVHDLKPAVARPAHGSSADLSSGEISVPALGPGGAYFHEFTSTSQTTARRYHVHVTTGGRDVRVRVMGWATDTDGFFDPAGRVYSCYGHRRGEPDEVLVSGGSGDIDFEVDPQCLVVALQVVNPDWGAAVSGVTLSLTSALSATIIGNGTVKLGVQATGNLNAWAPLQPGQLYKEWASTLALSYTPTARDGISDCGCEGWGAAFTDTEGNGLSGYVDDLTNLGKNLDVLSFTATDTEATSTVRVRGTPWRVTHHYHPSPDPRLYQVDVTITGGLLAPPEVTYRRMMSVAIPPEYDQYYTLAVADADRTQVPYTSDDGFNNGDPLGGPSYGEAEGTFTDLGPTYEGGLFDLRPTLMSNALFGDVRYEMTLYYGAAGTVGDLTSALQGQGVGTYLVVKPAKDKDNGTPNSYGFGVKFPVAPAPGAASRIMVR